MHTLLHRVLPALVFTVALLTFPLQSRAGGNVGDDTNAASIPAIDATTWAQNMQQVMGTSNSLLSTDARGPAGVYAVVQLSAALAHMHNAGVFGKENVDNALYYYVGYLLENVAVSGIALLVKWEDLSPTVDPGDDFSNVEALRLDYIDYVLKAIDAWNSGPHFLQNPKTLQLIVTPGFNSPPWLFEQMGTSCDGLFTAGVKPATSLSGCGYTGIFYDVEGIKDVNEQKQKNFPLPWNDIYKTKWRSFLGFINYRYGSNPDFVSIAVAGPTASSAEMILPNGDNPDLNRNASGTLQLGAMTGISVYTAWNCLLGNNYGVTGDCITDPNSYGTGTSASDYVNSNRAFIEEWAAAIDMYGQIFSGVTLVATTGQGLPNFPNQTNPYFSKPPIAFAPDCGSPPPPPTMDCAAETAILAYFAAPPVGGPNAKATEMDGLSTNPGPLSSLSVKWLSEKTAAGLSVLNGSPALVSRMLGGAQFGSPFSSLATSPPTPVSEQNLLAVLENFFTGTRAASIFGVGTGANGTEPVVNAPINYLQVWDQDLIYAAGLSNCLSLLFQNAPPPNGGPPPGCAPENMNTSSHTVPFMGMRATAEYLLGLANYAILLNTAEAVALPAPCGCSGGFVQRGAFLGDPVCVTQMQQNQVTMDNTNANASSTGTYSSDYTNRPIPPPPPPPLVPYGICKQSISPFFSLAYRQAYMGDYVCVTSNSDPLHPGEWQQVASDNASYPSNVKFCPPAGR
jgi:hypothetical protein